MTHEQEDRLHGEHHPKVIQNECESDGRVLYSIVAETDDFGDNPAQDCIEAIERFAEEWIGIDEYRLCHSGNRSIHLETNQYVTDEGRKRLKELAGEFNEESEISLDTSIYSTKRPYRIIGAKHRETDRYKREIDTNDDRPTIFRRAKEPVDKETFHDLPRPEEYTGTERDQPFYTIQQFAHYSLPKQGDRERGDYSCPGDSNREPIPSEFEGQLIRGYLKGQSESTESTEKYHRPIDRKEPFSPYIKTGDKKDRSVIVAKQVDGLLCRMDDRDKVYVPALIEYAIGGGDGSYTRHESGSLISLSKRDYAKWDYEPGDWVVIIGGRSGSSRILSVHESDAMFVGMALRLKGREKALEALRKRGYDVGERGKHGDKQYEGTEQEPPTIERMQKLENGEIERSFDNLFVVADGLLQMRGWDGTWRWIRDLFGPGFNAQDTYDYLSGIVDYFDDLDHIDVPESVDEAKQ